MAKAFLRSAGNRNSMKPKREQRSSNWLQSWQPDCAAMPPPTMDLSIWRGNYRAASLVAMRMRILRNNSPTRRRMAMPFWLQIFGSKDVSRGVANQAADLSGVGSAILMKMLPVIAAMIHRKAHQEHDGRLVIAAAARREASSGGLEDMIKDVLGGGQQSGQGSQGGGGGIWAMFLAADSRVAQVRKAAG